MKNSKFSTIPPLVENDTTFHLPAEKSNVLNKFLASKSIVSCPNDPAPELVRKEGVPDLNLLKNEKISGFILRNTEYVYKGRGKKKIKKNCGIFH